MGRRKVSMEYIQKDKKRSTTYEKRKKGLLKKAYELATLCDVPLCMVIYPAGPNSVPVTYPEKEEEVGAVMNRYVSGSREENAKRRLNLEQGLALGKKKKSSESDIPGSVPPQQQSQSMGYPSMDGLNRDDLVNLASVLDCKLRQVEERMRSSSSVFYNANVGGGGDHGMMMMQWPMCTASSSSSVYDIPNSYCPQLPDNNGLPPLRPQPLTSFYNPPGLNWHYQL